ncbi:MAG: peroxiredoxin [Hydrogenophilales bacterium]|nr:peroxiredoxin [Hydrogenophilales bacterium]
MKYWVLFIAAAAVLTFILVRASHAGDAPQPGQAAPDFNLPDQRGKLHRPADYRGKWLVLYFYPKDDTPGCTKQACAFRDDIFTLRKLGAEVVGVSVDDTASHAEFAKKYSLPFPLLADQQGATAERYGSLAKLVVMKFAKRNTFLIDPQGLVAKVYLSAEAGRNSEQVIADLKALLAGR